MKIKTYIAIALAGMLTAGCSKEIPDGSRKVEVQIRVVSQNTQTKVGDPGEDSGEDLEWDRLAVIFGGTDGTTEVVKQFLTFEDYMKLPESKEHPNARQLPMVVPVGTYHIYGIAYKETEHKDINTLLNGNNLTTDQLANYTIDNQNATNKEYFLTLAADVTETPVEVGGETQSSAHLEVNRLAAKIDVQWDAQDAYEQGFTDVEIQSHTFTGPKTGYLFPALNKGTTTTTGETITRKFVNTSPISKRNGRIYHYTFLDGKGNSSFLFNITAKQNDETGEKSVTGSYTFPLPELQRQSWYKINVTIKSVEDGSHTINIPSSNP